MAVFLWSAVLDANARQEGYTAIQVRQTSLVEGARTNNIHSLAIGAQKEYRQIQHICNWDLAITYLSLGQYALAYDNLEILEKESNWSKAAYAYGTAITLYETLDNEAREGEPPVSPTHKKTDQEKRARVTEVMHTIPGHLKKIAGKSLPFEVSQIERRAQLFAE